MRISAAVACCLAWTASAAAAEPTPLSEAELDGVRAGFVTSSGVVLDFGASVKTHLDGRLALESTLMLNAAGRTVTTVTGDLGPLVDGQVIVPGVNGDTRLIHNIGGDGVRNVVLNTADGRDVRQEIGVTITLAPGFEAYRRGMAVESTRLRLSWEMNAVPGVTN